MWVVITLFHKYECINHKIIVLFITVPPYIDHDYGNFVGISPTAIFGEAYDIECPYESNPPA